MQRRAFLAGAAAAAISSRFMSRRNWAQEPAEPACCSRTHASPPAAMQSPRETLVYVPAVYTGTRVDQPDYLATVDVDPQSATFGQVIQRLEMPYVGDELHHFGWNACSSCHGDPTRSPPLPGPAGARLQPDLHRGHGRAPESTTPQGDFDPKRSPSAPTFPLRTRCIAWPLDK